MAQQKVFDAGSPGFIWSVLTALLTATGIAGIEYPQAPGEIADQLISTFNNTGVYGIIGILVVSVITPIWNFVRKKQPLNFKAVFGSVTTWVSLGGVLVSGLMLLGLEIPANTPANIAGAITARNWGLLGSLLTVAVVIPVIRYIKSRKTPATP